MGFLRDLLKTVPALRGVLSVGAVLTVFACFFGVRAGYSTAAGVVIGAAELYLTSRTVAGLVGAGSGGARLVPVVLIKFLLLATVILLIVSRGAFSPLAILVGLGSLPLGIVVSAFWPRAGGSL